MLVNLDQWLQTPRSDEEIVRSFSQERHVVIPYIGTGNLLETSFNAYGWRLEPVWMMDTRIPRTARELTVDLQHAGLNVIQLWYGHPDIPDTQPQVKPIPAPISAPSMSYPDMQPVLHMVLAASGVLFAGVLALVNAIANDPALFILTASGNVFLAYSWEV